MSSTGRVTNMNKQPTMIVGQERRQLDTEGMDKEHEDPILTNINFNFSNMHGSKDTDLELLDQL